MFITAHLYCRKPHEQGKGVENAMKIPKSFTMIMALLYGCALLVGCSGDQTGSQAGAAESQLVIDMPLGGPGIGTDAQTSVGAVQTAYDTQGLVVRPVPVEKGADQLADNELTAIFKQLHAVAEDLYDCDIFELDKEDTLNADKGQLETYYAITNFETEADIMRNYTAIFSYRYFQETIFTDMFLAPYTVGGLTENAASVLWGGTEGDKQYLAATALDALIPADIDKQVEETLEVIYKSADMFKVRLEYGWPGGSTTPYVYTVLNQNGLWVLDSYYSFDIMECTHLDR